MVDFLKTLIYGDDDWDLSADEIPDPVSRLLAQRAPADVLKKCSDFSWDGPITDAPIKTREVNLEKRSSARGRVRLEKAVVDGETWVLGYDHRGECVYTKVLY